jgi:glycosyltransferase involved in cell wall biosynthesis
MFVNSKNRTPKPGSNLLILCHELSPIGGGAGNFTKYLADELGKLDHFARIVIVTSNYKNRYKFIERMGGIEVYRLPIIRRHIDRTNAFELITYTALSFILVFALNLKRRFDFALGIHGIPAGLVTFLLFKIAKVPYGISLRGADVPGFLPQRYSKFHKRTLFAMKCYWKNAEFITFNVEQTYELTKRAIDRINNNIHIIPNGVDRNFFRPPTEKDFSQINIVYSGRLTEQKNVELLIRSLKALVDKKGGRSIPLKVNIAGEGDLRKKLESLVTELNLGNYITFYGWLDKDKLRGLYQSSHIFVLPSLYEGMSNSLLEALASGLAIISTDFNGYEALVRNGENGFLIDSNDLESLSSKMLHLLEHVDLIKSMGLRSRQISELFSWQSVGRKYFKLISEKDFSLADERN